ncbi:SDR family oxidoreductase [Dactylosporangium sp. AC04546]|uniref:SDR family NAD(P)-dependent oxidoreductase n=1 Tax=Dactylosporangium sp. AC04546 TaxID=2862460 RepID=UPI001EE0E5FF|nr:SDR family oxidoreductase [Dactylosporangium sp. AC04546]WVK80885.1 SDR family oxidoreductase [Dactylosporangium sp. AC04546]
MARRFASEGGHVVLVDRDAEGVSKVAAEIGDAVAEPADVSSEDDVAGVVSAAVERFGRIDALYNGAAILIAGEAMTSPLADLQRQLSVNVVGTYLMCKAVGRVMKAQGSGAIVNTSSVVADVARANRSLYAATKGAILPMSRHFALELAPAVRVNCVSPGPTLTGMTRPHYMAAAATEVDALRRVGSQVLLDRVADPSEIASAICFLLSDDAGYVNGTMLTVDGGMTAE